jgi:hypothetical protein
MKGVKLKKVKFLVFILIVFSFLYFGSKATFTSYESSIRGNINSSVGKIKIKINDIDVTNSGALDNSVLIDNITWTSNHVREGKIAPGSSGSIELDIDATGSDVAIKFDLELIDKSVDNDKLITFTKFTDNSGDLIRTGVSTYSGIITLDDIASSDSICVTLDFSFLDDGDMEAISEDDQNLDDLFVINFHAIQYNGEELVKYTD